MATWGPLRGEYVQVRELAATLRAIADQRGQTVRGLAQKIPHSRSVISANLNGSRRPDWKFVEAFLTACAGRDQQALEVLRAKVRPLWEAADPDRATLLPVPVEAVAEEHAGQVVPAEVRQWVALLAEVAGRQHVLARAQLAVSRHQALSTGLLQMLDQLADAVAELTQERDTLRGERDSLLAERRQHTDLEGDLIRIRQELEDTQRRLEAAEQLYEQTSRRLDQSERQRAQAERLKDEALQQVQTLLRTLDAPPSLTPGTSPPPRSGSGPQAREKLMDSFDQQAGNEILSRLDDVLADEAAGLSGLRRELIDTTTAPAAGPERVGAERVDPPAPAGLELIGQDVPADTPDTSDGPDGPDTAPTRADSPRTAPADRRANRVVMVGFTSKFGLLIVGCVVAAAIVTGAVVAWQLYDPDRLTRTTLAVTALAYSPDGKLLAIATQGDTIQLWDPQARLQVGTELSGHTGIVNALAFSPDGKLLASAGDDRTVRLWNPATGQPVGGPLTGHTGIVTELAFSPDGKLLASAGGYNPNTAEADDTTVRLWDPANGQPIGGPLTGHTTGVYALAFSPDGKLLASAGGDNDSSNGSQDPAIRLWDPATREPVGAPIAGQTWPVLALAFSPDGKILASGSDYSIRLWDPATRLLIGDPLQGHTNAVSDLAFSPDGKLLASASGDNAVRLWDPATRLQLAVLTHSQISSVEALAFNPDQKTLAYGGYSNYEGHRGLVRLVDVSSWRNPS
ncbi:helix-turn-helix domain-containing protein [Nonomuraea sp. NPDC050547]|uniref:WD40 repeat domain-containing protein n=1 Tax=Nonomuraea sp. NPDC050547 TaxID=3364368 RepID=UPI00378DC3ED